MSDRLHTHVTFGFEPTCPACDQVAEQLQIGAGLLSKNLVGASSN